MNYSHSIYHYFPKKITILSDDNDMLFSLKEDNIRLVAELETWYICENLESSLYYKKKYIVNLDRYILRLDEAATHA